LVFRSGGGFSMTYIIFPSQPSREGGEGRAGKNEVALWLRSLGFTLECCAFTLASLVFCLGRVTGQSGEGGLWK
jgi:hypothetical protein